MASMLSGMNATARPAAMLRRSAPRAPAGLGLGALPVVRRSAVRVSSNNRSFSVSAVSTPIRPGPERLEREFEGADLSSAPPFTLSDIRAAIPDHCWERNALKSMGYLIRDVAIVLGLAAGAFAINSALVWPIYWLAQGTMFWALFVVGHDCFSSNNTLNDFVGGIVHSSILVPYHGWRVSHRTHHSNHGHVENDESWHPTTKSLFDSFNWINRMGRLSLPLTMLVRPQEPQDSSPREPRAPWFSIPMMKFVLRTGHLSLPISLLAYPMYLFFRSPGKEGSHFDPNCELFVPQEKNMVLTSNACLIAMLGVLGACAYALGPLAVVNLYIMPYIVYIMWLDAVTYLHHHGEDEKHAQMPWYRGAEWSYLRGGLTTLDRDFGFLNKIHHNIETHVVHHLFPQIPHYNLVEATEAVKPVMGAYYREPERSKGPIPFHLLANLFRSFKKDHYVEDTGDIVYYKKGF